MALDRKEIVDVALALLNEVGIDKLSTRTLAARLGVAQPALYWHFRNKSALLDALNAEMLDRYLPRRRPKPREKWDAFTLAYARAFRRALLSVRDGARLNAGTRPNQAQFADAERQLELYVQAGFSAREALHISIAVARYVVGFVVEEQDERQDAEDDTDGPIDQIAPFPILAEAIGPLLAQGTINTESVFEGGIAYLIDGIRASLARRSPRTKTAP
jgi:TetR/AcrR family tetracycline transcriptional repressor